jgi:hypothetical protein
MSEEINPLQFGETKAFELAADLNSFGLEAWCTEFEMTGDKNGERNFVKVRVDISKVRKNKANKVPGKKLSDSKKLDCINEELFSFRDDTCFSEKQYRESIQRIKNIMEDKR